MKLTIIICTHNRSELLLKTIDSINNARIPNQVDLSILVIPNACRDDTLNKLTEYQRNRHLNKSLSLEFVEELAPGKSNALNKALEIIRDGWICFIDDDHRVDANYFQSVIATIEKYPGTKLFCGKIIPDWTGKEPIWAHETGQFKITPYPVPYFDLGNNDLLLSEKNSIPGGGNLVVARDVFDKVGKFSTVLGPKGHNLMGSEDSDFVIRALRSNEMLRYIPDIVQYHYVNLEHFKIGFLIKKSFQRNRSITLTKYPEKTNIPLYLWLKVLQYSGSILFSFNTIKSRFYLTRLAGILGQIMGYRQSKPL
ncbi:MAG: glycosyltransferase family 2 protein [Methylomicrobium sp.]|nr:glycosyltransferase family 2 protein [Methylomicrobium sp.]